MTIYDTQKQPDRYVDFLVGQMTKGQDMGTARLRCGTFAPVDAIDREEVGGGLPALRVHPCSHSTSADDHVGLFLQLSPKALFCGHIEGLGLLNIF